MKIYRFPIWTRPRRFRHEITKAKPLGLVNVLGVPCGARAPQDLERHHGGRGEELLERGLREVPLGSTIKFKHWMLTGYGSTIKIEISEPVGQLVG